MRLLFIWRRNTGINSFYFKYIIGALYYTWIMFYFPQRVTGVPCPPCVPYWIPPFIYMVVTFCLLGKSLSIPVSDSAVYAGVVEGLRWYGGFDWYWGLLSRLT